MNEQEFVIEAKKQGITEENIKGMIGAYTKLKPDFPEITYEELLERIIQIQKDEENNPRSPLDCD